MQVKIQLDYLNIKYTLISILKDMCFGILHHVANEHEWVLLGVNGWQCAHAPLIKAERNKPWLKKNSAAHRALAKIVLDKRFLHTITYFINFRYSCTTL